MEVQALQQLAYGGGSRRLCVRFLQVRPNLWIVDECEPNWAILTIQFQRSLYCMYADQNMWGKMVETSQCGPAPCPVNKLTADILATKLVELTSEDMQKNAMELSRKMKNENGVQSAVDHLIEFLPRDNLCCDVSLIRGEVNHARYRADRLEIKVSPEVAAVIIPIKKVPSSCTDRLKYMVTSILKLFQMRKRLRLSRYAVYTYALGNPTTFWRGCVSGFSGCLSYMCYSPMYVFSKSYKYAKKLGWIGFLYGLFLAPFYAIWAFFFGLAVFIDRFLLGILNGCCGKHLLYVVDPTVRSKVYDPCSVSEELKDYPRPNGTRKEELKEAIAIAKEAATIFRRAPCYMPAKHWHWKVAKADKIHKNIHRFKKLTSEDRSVLKQLLEVDGENEISFSRFCLYIGTALQQNRLAL